MLVVDGIRTNGGVDPLVDPGTLAAAAPEDVQATFCSVLVDTWIGLGSTMAFVAPGSRSTPLALALVSDPRMRVDVLHDERTVAFAALGYGVATGRAAVAVCTSGTAAAHFHAAVIEADLSGVPLLICTADRPPELRDVGAPQTIDQTNLFGSATRWFHDPGVPSAASAPTWRSVAARAIAATCGLDPGPVHVNLPFREPLVGRSLVARGTGGSRRHEVGRPLLDGDQVEGLALSLRGARSGLIVAGRGCGDPDAVEHLARSVGWPVIADSRSGCQESDVAVLHADAILRVPEFADRVRPDLVVRLGESPASKVVNQWIAATGAEEWHISGRPDVYDPQHRIGRHITADVSDLCRRLAADGSRPSDIPEQSRSWFGADAAARAALSAIDGSDLADGVSVARAVIAALPAGTNLVVSSSMPVRDVEWFGGSCSHLAVHANRGANGIDGVVATAIGVERGSGRPTAVLIGDVALVHDASSLLSLGSLDADVRIVVVDNDGGGIFHHLPQASSVDPAIFETIYGTPHGVDLVALARAAGLPAETVIDRSDLDRATSGPGPRLVRVATDRTADVAAHRRAQDAVAAAVRSTMTSEA